ATFSPAVLHPLAIKAPESIKKSVCWETRLRSQSLTSGKESATRLSAVPLKATIRSGTVRNAVQIGVISDHAIKFIRRDKWPIAIKPKTLKTRKDYCHTSGFTRTTIVTSLVAIA